MRASTFNFLASADYSQLENRIMALVSGDPQLVAWYAADVDVHTETAKILFQLDKIDKPRRELSKRARYAYHYGAQAKTIYESLSVEFPALRLGDCQAFMARLDKLHPGIRRYLDTTLATAHRNGYVEDPISGRRYHFFGQIEEAKVFNIPIQSAAASVINPAALELYAVLEHMESILMQIHDSLVLEGPDLKRLADLLLRYMQRTVELNGVAVSFPVDVSVGINWGELVKVGPECDLVKELAKRHKGIEGEADLSKVKALRRDVEVIEELMRRAA